MPLTCCEAMRPDARARIRSKQGVFSAAGECRPCHCRRNDMAHAIVVAFSLVAAASQPLQHSQVPVMPAPPGTPTTRYCLRVDPLIGSRIETVQCKTRDEWAALDIDVDQE